MTNTAGDYLKMHSVAYRDSTVLPGFFRPAPWAGGDYGLQRGYRARSAPPRSYGADWYGFDRTRRRFIDAAALIAGTANPTEGMKVATQAIWDDHGK